MKTLLNEQMRTKRTQGKSTYYHVKDTVTSGTQTTGNVNIPDSLLTHSQEEADMLLILHAVSVPHETEFVVSSPDTDVLLLVTSHHVTITVAKPIRSSE